jgi:hypothetical protein
MSKTILIAPEQYLWNTPSNVALAAPLGSTSDTRNRITPSQGQGLQTGQVIWNTRFPEGLVESDPKVAVSLDLVLFYNGTVKQNADFSGTSGLASFPFNRCISTSVVKFGTQVINDNPSRNVDLVAHSMNPQDLALLSPASRTDDYSKFDISYINDPLRIGGNSIDAISSRGLGNNYVATVSGGTTDTITIHLEWEESLLAQPFSYKNPSNPQPFKDLSTFMLTLNVNLDPTKFFCLNGATINAPHTVTVSNINYELLVRSWNPSKQISAHIPSNLIYSGALIDEASNDEKAFAAGHVGNPQVITSKFTLTSIPSMFAVKVSKPHANYGTYSNAYISGLSIDMDNDTNILQGFNEHQLYNLSCKNGYNKRYATFAKQPADPTAAPANVNLGAGPIIFFKPSDLPLNDDSLANVSKALNVTLRTTVIPDAAETVSCQVFCIYDNMIINEGNEWRVEKPLRTPDQVLKAPVHYSGSSQEMNHVMGGASRNGGGFWDWLSAPWFKRTVRFARNNIPMVSDLARDGTFVGNLANSAGYGNKSGGDLVRLGNGKGKAKKGGKGMSKALMEELNNIPMN